MENNFYNHVYFVVAVIFVIWQGPLYFKWHPRKHDVYNTEYWRETLLNTIGSLIGWMAGYYLIFFRLLPNMSNLDFKWSDFVILVIFFYGANGQLPNMAINKVSVSIGK